MTTDLIKELRSAAATLRTPYPAGFLPLQDKAAAELLDRAAQAIAHAEASRLLARYWKQRAKSAEGHLFASDAEAAARNIYGTSKQFGSVAWEQLTEVQRRGFYSLAYRALSVIDHRRRQRAGRFGASLMAPALQGGLPCE